MIHLTIQQLSASLDGALTGPSLDLVVRHLAMCTECRERQARLVRTDDALRRLLAQQTTDAFLDDLSMRAESWIAAIAQGLPEPGARPHAAVPATPTPSYTPPPPPMPEPAPSPSVVHQAGWGVIGMKPSVPAQAPASDPDETRRLLEAMERAERSTVEATHTPTAASTPPTAAPNDLPTWLQEQSRRAAESHLPQGPGLAQASAPPTTPFPREASAPAWPLPQPQVESPRPWFVPTPAPTPAMAVPQEHAAYAPPSMQPSASVPAAVPMTPAPTPMTMPTAATPTATAPSPMTIPQPPAPEPIGEQVAHTLPGQSTDRYLSFEQHRELTRGTSKGLRVGLTIGLTLVAGAALVLLSLQLAPTAVRERLGERLREIVQRRTTNAVTTITPVTTTTKPVAAAPTTTPVVSSTVDALVPATTTTTETTPTTVAATATPVAPVVVPTVTPKTTPTTTTSTSTHGKPVVTATDDSHWLQSCGVVVDGKGQPIAGAQITVTEIALTLRTDAQGRFCIAAPAGPQHLLIDAPGFTQVRQSVRFAQGSPDLRLQLTRVR
jgi:hypothetical protein